MEFLIDTFNLNGVYEMGVMFVEAFKMCLVVAAIGFVIIGSVVFAFCTYAELKTCMKNRKAAVILTILAAILGAILGIPAMIIAMLTASD